MRQGKLHELTVTIKLTISHEVILKYIITYISNQNILIEMHHHTNEVCAVSAVCVVKIYPKIM